LETWNIAGSPNQQLNTLSNLMLAQAQEVFLKKAIAGIWLLIPRKDEEWDFV
jgi:hypothetical protein